MKNKELGKLLVRRKLDVTKLAAQIYSGRCHLTQVLLGRRRGERTWSKLEKVLEPQELKAAKKFADAERALRERSGQSVGGFPRWMGESS